jgi:hypothetical protein
MIVIGENRKTRRKACLSAVLSATNPRGLKLREKRAANRLIYSTAQCVGIKF